ncbi:membrane protein [Pilimelia anulata]|uniref:Membrane protein n=1 Tax=Pilimelia anulata TaxID=53371 RepID=A0A8J3FCX5_9ACTN|nr:DUF4395 family protein [Pilimelia anulata]GGK10340.1 membrane protein [Pilimelia anulata]
MELDPRGPRFNAAVTAAVFVAILLVTPAAPAVAGGLAAAQAVVFAATAVDPRRGPYALLYRGLVAPRLGPPADREPAAPVRFAQAVGCCFALAAAAGFLLGAATLGYVGAAFALVAAFLNAAFGLCLGCECYLAARRLTAGRRHPGA